LIETIKAVLAGELARLHTAFVAEFVSYNASTGLASIQPAVHLVNRDTGDTQPRAIIPNVPVVFPQGNGVGIRWEPQAGDKCFCIVNERSIDRWIDDGEVADPQVTRRHDITDAICLPFSVESNSPQTDGITIDKDGLVTVGSGATDFVAQAGKVLTELNSMATTFNTHTHILTLAAAPGAGGTGTAAVPVTSMSPSPVASTNLKSED
jgi:hypothetical protein